MFFSMEHKSTHPYPADGHNSSVMTLCFVLTDPENHTRLNVRKSDGSRWTIYGGITDEQLLKSVR